MSVWNRQLGVLPSRSTIARYKAEILLGLGVFFRLLEYFSARTPWLDEGSLADNIYDKSLAGLFGPLRNVQLAPPGFLALEWPIAHLLNGGILALRLVPLLAGIAALFLFRKVASRVLGPRAALIALGMFALSDDLIYFATELKPYSSDVAVGLACYLAAFAACSEALTARRLAALALFVALAVWFSYAAVFVLAGTGLASLASALAARRWRQAAALALLGTVAGASVAALYFVSLDQLGHKGDMWLFWDFAFPPRRIGSAWDATWPLRRVLYLFVNPLNFGVPFGPLASAAIPFGLFLAGLVRLWSRDRTLFGMLVLPGLLALVAGALRLYPFHGRLVLFLVPALLMLIAEGTDALRPGPLLWLALTALFLYPTLVALGHCVENRPGREFSPHGDLRPYKLDPIRFPWPGLPVEPPKRPKVWKTSSAFDVRAEPGQSHRPANSLLARRTPWPTDRRRHPRTSRASGSSIS